ncbi:MAG TPA: hypothetical protein VE422_44330, partial [Terriglobia bacterium]|nr:hypothetical protein [Terriglobia bacterium]
MLRLPSSSVKECLVASETRVGNHRHFKQAAEALTGRVWQNGAVQTVGEIMDGKVNGDLVSFNISGPLDGASRGVV